MPLSPPLGRRLAAFAAAFVVATLGLTAQALAFAPSARLDVAFAPGSPAPPLLGMPYGTALDVANDGDAPLDGIVVVDTLPVELDVVSVTTGRYTGLTDFAVAEGVRVSYEKNTAPGVFTLWGSSPNTTTNTTLTAPPGLGAGEYITRLRWQYGQAAVGMQPTTAPIVTGRVTNPDNAGGPVAVGDSIQHCANLIATTGNLTRNDCLNFNLIAGPAVAIQAPDSTPLGSAVHATATLSGGDPTGELAFQVFAAGDAGCTTPLLDEEVEVDGVGAYDGPDFPADQAGAYKWVARYGGDGSHAAGATACNNPAGAFVVVAPPVASVAFGAPALTVGESTALTFEIASPAANTVPLTGVAVASTLPAGLAVAAPNDLTGSCGGTVTAASGSQSVTLAGGTIAPGASCSFSVTVTASAAGVLTATTGTVQSANGGAGNTATASLTVGEPEAEAPPPAAPTPPVPPPVAAAPAPPPLPETAQELARSCTPVNLVLLRVTAAGRRVRFLGIADPSDAGQQVTIRSLPARTVAAQGAVQADGTFEATGPRPSRRVLNRTRYYAELGDRRSPDLKLTRRLTARLTVSDKGVTISGRVAPPLDKPVRRVVIRRLTTCAGGYEDVARIKPGRRGRFQVTLPRTAGPALYLAQTRVRTRAGGAMQTFSLTLAGT